VTINGTIAKINDDPTGEYELELDAGGGNIVAVHFADNGLAFKKSNPKVGGAVAASKCNVTVPQGNKLSLAICEAK
jgi:hypothetical protein